MDGGMEMTARMWNLFTFSFPNWKEEPPLCNRREEGCQGKYRQSLAPETVYEHCDVLLSPDNRYFVTGLLYYLILLYY